MIKNKIEHMEVEPQMVEELRGMRVLLWCVQLRGPQKWLTCGSACGKYFWKMKREWKRKWKVECPLTTRLSRHLTSKSPCGKLGIGGRGELWLAQAGTTM